MIQKKSNCFFSSQLKQFYFSENLGSFNEDTKCKILGVWIMTAEDLANYLHINRQVAARMVREKKIPGHKPGEKWLFQKSIIDKWLEDKIREERNAA